MHQAPGAMILALKILPVRDAIPLPADTCERSHISTRFLRLAGASRIGVPRNHPRAGPLVLLESAGAERFGKIECAPA